LLEGIETRSACVGVVGLGYVGLPLIVAFGQRGFRCIGIELDRRKCELLTAGRSYIPDVPSEAVQELVGSGRLRVSDDYSALCGADAIIICVPTPVYRDKRPDLRDVVRAGEAIGQVLGPGQLVVLESTCYPGTTEDLLRPVLERESDLRSGDDFWLAFSPERIDPGNQDFGLSNTPKVVGGIDTDSAKLAAALYAHIVPEVVTVSSTREAEMSKLIENTFRHVNIALANELAQVAEGLGIDFWEAIRAASSKPFGFMPFYPGPGVGGHCIPVDPHYLAWKAREHDMPCRLIDTAEYINAAMPRRVVERVVEEVNNRGLTIKGARILLLGMSYKRGIGDVRESPAVRIAELLEGRGAKVSYHDPHVPTAQWNGHAAASSPLTEEMLSSQACVLLLTDHGYDLEMILRHSRLLIDTRNAVKDDQPNCVRLWAKSHRNGPPAMRERSVEVEYCPGIPGTAAESALAGARSLLIMSENLAWAGAHW
jgi:UDP-N-acetyl-D-glucosamine dehydrogenase